MSVFPADRCHAGGCPAGGVLRCYLCPNVCCAEHGTISASGTICGECSARERAKQAQATEAAHAQQAAAKASGCLVALVTVLVAVGRLVMSLLPNRHGRVARVSGVRRLPEGS